MVLLSNYGGRTDPGRFGLEGEDQLTRSQSFALGGPGSFWLPLARHIRMLGATRLDSEVETIAKSKGAIHIDGQITQPFMQMSARLIKGDDSRAR